MKASSMHILKSPGKYEGGFTLIELSIVLVIIGLIVGGILTGQDLIKAAEQRATLAQIEKYNTAVNTFRNKYGYIPGDMPLTNVNNFALGVGGATNMTVAGDGNGILTDGGAGASSANADSPYGEILLFWQQLSQAGLVDGNWGSDLTTTARAPASGVVANDFPLAKLGRGNYLTVGSGNTEGFNFYALAGLGASFTGGASGAAVFANGTDNLNPIEAYNMDKKVDDGMPNTGTVQARTATLLASALATPADDPIQVVANGNNSSPTAASSTAGKCQTGNANGATASNTYNVNTANNSGTTPACSMRFRFN